MNAHPGTALILFPGAIGDLLCCWPALDALRAAGHALTLAARPDAAAVLPSAGLRIESIDRREVADLFASGPLAPATTAFFGQFARVDSFTGAAESAFAARLTMAAGHAVSVHPFRGMTPGEHAVAYYARCLAVAPRLRPLPLPDEATAWAAALWPKLGLGTRALAIHPGSGSAAKNWEGMAALADAWRRDGGRVVALLGPAERERGTAIPADAVVAGEPLARVAAAARRAHRYLGNDSGISHLAGMVGADALVLFADSDPVTWAPPGPRVRVLRGLATCDRCGAGRFCTHRLSIDAVRAALRGPPLAVAMAPDGA